MGPATDSVELPLTAPPSPTRWGRLSIRWGRLSIRWRTTLVATGVVTLALVVGSAILAWLMAQSLTEGLETTAEQQIAVLSSNLPPEQQSSSLDDDDEADVEDLVWQVFDSAKRPIAASAGLTAELPLSDDEIKIRLPGSEEPYLVTSEQVDHGGNSYFIAVAVSTEPVADALGALITPLALGVPLLLIVVAATTWLVVGRALAPVESIRREVTRIGDEDLGRRVPQPASRDEISHLARTMNQMLDRLESARQRQHQFVADASHELRTPLASITQYAEVAKAHPSAVPPGELVEAVLEESARMQALISQLLLLARLDDAASALSMVEVDLDDLVMESVARARLAGASVDISGVGAARVLGDPMSLRQVVDNLVGNACRFAEHTVWVRLEATADRAILTVEDDGPGIDLADRDRIFERFTRLDSARSRDTGGTGLGLAIVAELVALHHGSVDVASSPKGGAKFVVTLPAS